MKNYGLRNSDSDIANIKDIPDGILTIQLNGSPLGTYDGKDNAIINIAIAIIDGGEIKDEIE